jgi:phage major head subunit gpT-like protein
MGIVNQSDLSDILAQMNAVYSTEYEAAFQNAATYMDPLIETINTASDTYKRVWITAVPKLRKALGSRLIKNLELEAYATQTADFEATVGIPRATVLSDQWNMFTPAIKGLAVAAKRHVDQLLKSELQGGKVKLTFDGQPFFSTAHDLDIAGSQANLLTSTALTPANFATAVATMRSYTDNQSQPIGVEPKFLVVPPALEKAGRDIVMAALIPNAAGTATQTNTYQGLVGLIVNPLLSNEPTVWYLTGDVNGIMPVAHIVFLPPNLVAKTSPSDENVFNNFQYEYGVDTNDDVSLGLWFQMIRCEG